MVDLTFLIVEFALAVAVGRVMVYPPARWLWKRARKVRRERRQARDLDTLCAQHPIGSRLVLGDETTRHRWRGHHEAGAVARVVVGGEVTHRLAVWSG